MGRLHYWRLNEPDNCIVYLNTRKRVRTHYGESCMKIPILDELFFGAVSLVNPAFMFLSPLEFLNLLKSFV